MKDKKDYQEAVANGGFLTHIKPVNKYSALCGHSPDSPNGFQFYRGRWKWTFASVDIDGDRTRWCKKCRVKFLKATEQYAKLMVE